MDPMLMWLAIVVVIFCATLVESRIDRDGQIEVGWSCPLENPSQNCSSAIARWQICDGIEHCRLYGEDESAGCRLYQDTNCTSWYGREYSIKCPDKGRCIDVKVYEKTNDCSKNVWDECSTFAEEYYWWKGNSTKFNYKEAYHCNSGECIDQQKVCNGDKDCKDGSDETHGCNHINEASKCTKYQLEQIGGRGEYCRGHNNTFCNIVKNDFVGECK